MMNGGEAADQMVSYAFKGGEVVLRLTGDGAKHLAIYLANLLKQGGPSKGKTTLKRMIADGKELSVQRIGIDEVPYFNDMAKKYGVMFVAVKDTKSVRRPSEASAGGGRKYTDFKTAGTPGALRYAHGAKGQCDIMFRTEDAARVDRIFDRLAISEHPDVAHIRSEIIRSKEEKDVENPTTARKEKGTRPSARTSKGKGDTAETKASVRAQIRELRKEKAKAPAIPKKLVKGKTGRGR